MTVIEIVIQLLCRIKNKTLPRDIYSIYLGASLVCLMARYARVDLGCAASISFQQAVTKMAMNYDHLASMDRKGIRVIYFSCLSGIG